ncbi:MAG: hypothetical protein ACI4IF_01450 [Acutalibacteraceae bacterium]
MKSRLISLTIPIIALLFLGGCVLSSSGGSIHSFCNRLNELDKGYEVTESGFIANSNTYSKFFVIDNNEILLKFTLDSKNRTEKMDIVYPIECNNSPKSLEFIKNLVTAFCNDEKISSDFWSFLEKEKVFSETSYETKETELDNIQLQVDTTELGTIITVYAK